MTYFNYFLLQSAIFSQLTADSSLAGLISGVYDHVPDDAIYPFITIGESQMRDNSNVQNAGTDQHISMRIFSREAGRKQAATIMERVVTLMHQGTLTVSGQQVLLVRFVSSTITLLDDGRTYQGRLNFRVLLTEV